MRTYIHRSGSQAVTIVLAIMPNIHKVEVKAGWVSSGRRCTFIIPYSTTEDHAILKPLIFII
jgi:hypothetical protein